MSLSGNTRSLIDQVINRSPIEFIAAPLSIDQCEALSKSERGLVMSKRQTVYSEFDSAVEREDTGFSDFLEIHGANLLRRTAAMVTTAMALFVGLMIFFG